MIVPYCLFPFLYPSHSSQVLHFVCQVRCQHIQSLTLSNRTNQRWTLKPVMEGEHWSGPPSFIIEPYQQNKAYEITYKPMVTTADGKKHLVRHFHCSAFLALEQTEHMCSVKSLE